MRDYLTLTEFRATGREVDQAELENVAGTELGLDQGGRVYAGGLYIEHHGDTWHLCIMRDSWLSDHLQTLEAILYGFARVEAMDKPADQQAAMIDEWQTFCRDEGLQCVSADEMPHESLTDVQLAYVRDYIERWERMELVKSIAADANETLRHALIAWLVWNDRNGCYSDEQCANEGLDPLTLQGALQLVTEQLK